MTEATKAGSAPDKSIVDMLSDPAAEGVEFDPQRIGDRSRGRPRSVAGGAGGHRVTLYLDDASLEAARSLGKGNVSQGIREALELASKL